MEVPSSEWEKLSTEHCALLQEHYDFYLASQRPETSSIIKGLAESEAHTARLWNIGIYGPIKLKWRQCPNSSEHMLTFICFSYSMLERLLHAVPRFKGIWQECLADLARYRMWIGDSPGYEFWKGISRYWYSKKVDEFPESGRLQHHLGILCPHDTVQRLYYYTKACISIHPFRMPECILDLFKFANQRSTPNQDQVATGFVRLHGQLFTQGVTDEAVLLAGSFLSDMKKYIGYLGAAFKLQGVYTMSSNIAAIFKYGQADTLLPAKFNQPTESAKFSIPPSTRDLHFSLSLAFQTFSIALDQIGNKNVYPTIHITLAFIWCLARNGSDTIQRVETFVPWCNLAAFLNTMIRDVTNLSVIESEQFPIFEGDRK